jgi:hypothetical protein
MNMYNPYAPNPYIQQGQQQDISGLNPVFQNIAGQQANQNMAMQQGAGLSQPSQMGGSGMNPMAMAAALRGGKKIDTSNLGARLDMALNSQASPYLQDQVSQLGSSTSNPFSDYNMGTNGFGNYGE